MTSNTIMIISDRSIFNKITITIALLLTVLLHAQKPINTDDFKIADRIAAAPQNIFTKFREAGMDPVMHDLTRAEAEKVEKAFAMMPPLHRKMLKKHLHSISFMDNMPNTALTSEVKDENSDVKKFNITFRAEILHETISQWATTKENTVYDSTRDPGFQVVVEAGNLDAIVYVLLHEATHVIDAVLNLTPHPDDRNALVEPTAFTRDIWHKMNEPVPTFVTSILASTRFRNGTALASTSAVEAYRALGKTPFVSLYAMASWFEDLAEIVTIFHLTKHLDQPFAIVVRKHNIEIFRFEPMKNKFVEARLKQLALFYS